MKYVIGIDGGGTKTEAVLLDREGRELGRARAGGGNPNTAGREAAATAMRHAIQTALVVASRATPSPLALEDVAGVGVGAAGAVGARDWLDATLHHALPGALVVSGHDAEVALVGALGVRQGIVAIAGTGSTVYGVNAGGEDALIDGWGYLLGDDGSGFAIGQAALRAFLHVHDGRAAPCPLTEAVGVRLKHHTREAITRWAYGGGKSARTHVSEIADFASVVTELAAQGDADADALVNRAADALVLSIWAAWRRLDLGACKVGLAGGLLGWDGVLAQVVTAKLADALPDVEPVPPKSDAATGAAWLAMHELGWREL